MPTAMGTLIPFLSLGISGGATAAVLFGAFVLHGMQPGSMLFKTQLYHICWFVIGEFCNAYCFKTIY